MLIASYHGLPEWLVRNLVFFIIGLALGIGFVFLSLRPDIRRLRNFFRRSRA
jgi:hypothetical protein